MQMNQLPHTQATLPNLLRKIVALVMTVALVALVLMFSAVLLVVILIVGTLAWAYLWWKMRHVRKQMREFSARSMEMEAGVGEGEVIEGEVIRVEVPRNGK